MGVSHLSSHASPSTLGACIIPTFSPVICNLATTRASSCSTDQQHCTALVASFLSASISLTVWSYLPAQASFPYIHETLVSPVGDHSFLYHASLYTSKLRDKHFKLSDSAPMLGDAGLAECNSSSLDVSGAEVTNETLIEEAWLVVNERFLDARKNKWSQAGWLSKKEKILQKPVSTRAAAYGIIRNMLSGLGDPYTRFLTPEELKQLSKYDMTGVGLSLGDAGTDNDKENVRVIGVILGSPAQIAGVKQGDELLLVNGVSVQGKSAFEASSLIQGPKDTVVTITVQHKPCDDIQTLSLRRQQSVNTPVYYHLEKRTDGLVGYIQLKEFNAVARRDLVTAMNRLSAAGATSILLDLRDNPGGLVQAGIEVAKIFLDKGSTVIYTVTKDPQMREQVTTDNSALTTLPLIVLVNERTASASEIVAAALHDNCRAVLVGRRTFGKGLIQSVFELSDGSGLILTVGKYVTPHLQDIDRNGILPDFKEIPGLNDLKRQIETCTITSQ